MIRRLIDLQVKGHTQNNLKCCIFMEFYIIMMSENIIIIIITKTSSTGPSLKNKVVYKCFRNHTSTCTTENRTKHNSGKKPTINCTLEPSQRSSIKHSVGKVIPQLNWASMKHIANWDVLNLDISNSNG